MPWGTSDLGHQKATDAKAFRVVCSKTCTPLKSPLVQGGTAGRKETGIKKINPLAKCEVLSFSLKPLWVHSIVLQSSEYPNFLLGNSSHPEISTKSLTPSVIPR